MSKEKYLIPRTIVDDLRDAEQAARDAGYLVNVSIFEPEDFKGDPRVIAAVGKFFDDGAENPEGETVAYIVHRDIQRRIDRICNYVAKGAQ